MELLLLPRFFIAPPSTTEKTTTVASTTQAPTTTGQPTTTKEITTVVTTTPESTTKETTTIKSTTGIYKHVVMVICIYTYRFVLKQSSLQMLKGLLVLYVVIPCFKDH